MAYKRKDLSGQVFGAIAVVSYHSVDAGGNVVWNCKCRCGRELTLRTYNVHRQGRGCKLCLSLIHGQARSNNARTPTYDTWRGMIERCSNPKSTRYPDYGGRGIVVCEAWRKSFARFFEDMGARPEGKTIDRINVNGNYELTNCRWTTNEEQEANKRAA